MTPGVVANVREVISSSLRSWIIESLEHFGVDSLVFLHVIQSILEQDVRSLRGEDALDDLWRCRLASVGSKRGGRDPKRQMNEDDLRRCVLLENMRACFKEDEFDVAEDFVDELLHRWTEEAQVEVGANGGMKNTSHNRCEEMDNEGSEETKDPVREYNEAFPALGESLRASPASQAGHASETTGGNNGNCAELLKGFSYVDMSLRNSENDCPKESMLSSAETAKCCTDVTKLTTRDFVNSRFLANTQQNDSVSLRSNRLLGRTNVVPDLCRRFSANKLRATDISVKNDCAVGPALALEDDSFGRIPMLSLQSGSLQKLDSHLAEMSNNSRPAQGQGSKFFPPLPPDFLSRTVGRILSEGLQGLPCCHVPEGVPDTDASRGCIQCSSRRLDFPIYMENEFGMLIRLGEDCSLLGDGRSNQKGGGKGFIDASHLVAGVGKDDFPVSLDSQSSGANDLLRTNEKIAEKSDLPFSGELPGLVLTDQGTSEVRRGHPGQLQLPRTAAASGFSRAHEVLKSMHQTDQQEAKNIGSCMLSSKSCGYSAELDPGMSFRGSSWDLINPEAREGLPNSDCEHLTGWTQPSGILPARSHASLCGSIFCTVGAATSLQLIPSQSTDFQCFGESDEMSRHKCQTASGDDLQMDLAGSSLRGRTRNQPDIVSRNAKASSSATGSCQQSNDGTLASCGTHESDSSSVVSREAILRLLADVIERDLMNYIAASLIPLFPDLHMPQDLFLPDAEMLAHIAVQNSISDELNCVAAVGGSTFLAGTCENDYMLYLHLAVRQENLHVDHVLNFQDFGRWRQCLLQQVGSGENISCICDLCHRALKCFADSRYEFVDSSDDRFEASHDPVAASEHALEHESLLIAKSEHKELQPEKQGPGSCFSSKPAFVMNNCLQNSSVGTGDFTGKFDGIITNNVPDRKDAIYSCSSVGEGDVLLKKYWQTDNVSAFGQNSLREIWPDGDADRKSEERCGLKEHFEENNNVLESFSWIPDSRFSGPLSREVALGNSVQVWLNSDASLAPATICKKSMLSSMKSCDKTVFPENACNEGTLFGSSYNRASYAFDLGASAANICDKVTSAAAICNKTSAANICSRPLSPSSFCAQSALTAKSCDANSSSTTSNCRNWLCADVAETVTSASSCIAPIESKLEFLTLSTVTPDKLLLSDKGSSSGESFQSALHEDLYSLWLNTSSTHSHESGPLCTEDTSSDSGSQSSDSDSNALHNSDAHYEADISSGDSSLDEGSSLHKASVVQLVEPRQGSADGNERSPSEAQILFGFSFALPSGPRSFSPVGIEDIVGMSHSKFQSSESSVDSSDATETETSESDVSQPYSAACDSVSEDVVIVEEFQGLLSDWDLRQPDVEKYEGPTVGCYRTDSEDQEEPECRNWQEYSSDNFGGTVPTWDTNLPDSENLAGLLFNCGQREVSDLEKFEKLKSIWDGTQLGNLTSLTCGCDPQEAESENFEGASSYGAFSQHDLEDFKGLSPSTDPEQSVSENYRKLSILWEMNQPKVDSFRGVWENNDFESVRGVASSQNQQKLELECGSGMMPAWNIVQCAQENSKVLKIDWDDEELQNDDAEAMAPTWNMAHQPSARSCMGLTSHLGQQESRVENLRDPTMGCEMVRSSSGNLKELTDDHDTVGDADNFEELKSIWEGKQSLKSVKGGNRQIKQIQSENSIASILDNNQQESDSENLTDLAKLKSIWEENEPHSESVTDLKLNWDSDQMGAECGVGLTPSCDQQSADSGSLKSLAALKSIWEEKQPKYENRKEVQQSWDGNQTEADDFVEIASSCDQQEAASKNFQNLAELKAIWEDTPPESENLKGMTCCKSESIAFKKLMPDLHNNHLNAENLLELGSKSYNQTADLQNSEDLRFIWEINEPKYENPNGLRSNLDQQELGTENIVRPVSSCHREASDSENFMLLSSLWERSQSETGHLSGRTSGWEVPESRSETSKDMMLTCDTNQKVVLECAGNDAGEFQDLTQRKSLWDGEQQMNLEILMGANWDINPNDAELGVGLTYNCSPQENDAGNFPNLAQLKSLWEEKQNKSESLRGAKPSWGTEQSETGNLMKVAPNQDPQDVGPENFQNLMQLKAIWDEKQPNSENLKGLKHNWDMSQTEAQYVMGLTSDQSQQRVDMGNFQSLTQLKSIWEEKDPNSESSNGAELTWDMNQAEMQYTMELPSNPMQQGDDPENFLNLNEVMAVWEGKQPSSENLERLTSCWEKQASEMENMAWGANQQNSENLMALNSGIDQQESDSRNLKDIKSFWEGQNPGNKNLKGPCSCWKQQGVESEILNSSWNMSQPNSESFDHSLFNLNCRKADSENFERVLLHGDIKQSNSEIFLDRKLADTKCFKRPISDRELRYLEFGGLPSNVDLWQSDSDELKQLISRWDKEQAESRGIRGLFSHFDSQQPNLAAEWQLAEVVNQLKNSDDASTSLWRLAGKNQDNSLPKLVPSENSAFQDEIPHRFVYQYAFFDPRDVRRCDLAIKDARTETIRHIYEPSNSIVRQLEDIFDDGQQLCAEESLTNLPNCVFRPIGERNSGHDSYQGVAASVGFAADVSDLSLQIKTPGTTDPPEVLEPSSPYQLYLGVESQTFVPRFRVHKELEKSAQTGEATPPLQNNECVFGMNVILSTIALLD